MGQFRFHFISTELHTRVNVNMILPTCLSEGIKPNELYKKGVKFQALWLLHGHTGDELDWTIHTAITRYAERNNLAVVMPSVNNSFYADTACQQKYWTFLTEELPLLIYSYFPISDKREDNFVAGVSMGGHGAMKVGMNLPDRFSAMACISGAGFMLDRIEGIANREPKTEVNFVFENKESILKTSDDIYYQAELIKQNQLPEPKIYICCGTDDFILDSCRASKQRLEEMGFEVDYLEEPGYGHEWEFWDPQIRYIVDEWLPLKRTPIFTEEE